MTSAPTIVFDCSNIMYRLFFGYQKGYPGISAPTKGIYTFLKTVARVAHELGSRRAVFCFDYNKYFRADLYSAYKLTKRATVSTFQINHKEVIQEILHTLHDRVLKSLGFRNVYKVAGYEADDLIASFCQGSKHPCVIVSNDSDMYQLLQTGCVSIYDLQRYYTENDFEEEYQMLANQWPLVRALVGGKDNIKGVPRVGPHNAIAFVRGVGDERANKLCTSEIAQAVVQHNLPLVTLPFADTPPIVYEPDDFVSADWKKCLKAIGIEELFKLPPIDVRSLKRGRS